MRGLSLSFGGSLEAVYFLVDFFAVVLHFFDLLLYAGEPFVNSPLKFQKGFFIEVDFCVVRVSPEQLDVYLCLIDLCSEYRESIKGRTARRENGN